jgi:branched-chain amino acid transport system ATP-binding protein
MSPQETTNSIALIERISRERGLTLLFTEHDMDVVFSVAEKITVLHQGAVLAEGTPENVKNDPDVQRIYLGEAA